VAQKYNRIFRYCNLLKKISTGLDGVESDLVASIDIEDENMYKAANNTPSDTDLGPNGIAFDEVPVQQFGYVDNGELAHPTQQIAREENGSPTNYSCT
jgi:hypothetical protein